jgi:transposase-like protein
MIPELRRVLKRLHYPLEVMLVCARWYAAYPLSFGKTPSPRHLEEMMQERGVFVDHSTVHRWALKILPVMAVIFRRRKRPVGTSWRMDEAYIKVAGQWKYLYRALDKSGANTAAIRSVNDDACIDVELRQSKYLNNIVEQDHRAVKSVPPAIATLLDRYTLMRHNR